jgi:hypothetical protein
MRNIQKKKRKRKKNKDETNRKKQQNQNKNIPSFRLHTNNYKLQLSTVYIGSFFFSTCIIKKLKIEILKLHKQYKNKTYKKFSMYALTLLKSQLLLPNGLQFHKKYIIPS